MSSAVKRVLQRLNVEDLIFTGQTRSLRGVFTDRAAAGELPPPTHPLTPPPSPVREYELQLLP